jgi:uncharacterized protein with HEPN domain
MHEINFFKEIEILAYLHKQIEAIERFNDGLDEEMFLRNDLVKNASLMKLLVLGEYTSHLDDHLKERFSEVQWQLIKKARNYYAHVYRGVDWIKVWETISNDIPTLKSKIENIIESLEKENNAKTN